MDRVCLCKKPSPKMMEDMEAMGKSMEHLHPDTGFALYCGKCHDPCALSWEMKKSEEEMKMEKDMMEETIQHGAASGLPKTVDSILKVAMGALHKDMEHTKEQDMRMQMMRHMKHTQWYITEEGDECGTVPAEEEIMTGEPMMDACTIADVSNLDNFAFKKFTMCFLLRLKTWPMSACARSLPPR